MIGSGICILNMNIEYEYWRNMQSRIEFYLSFLMLSYRYIEGLFPFESNSSYNVICNQASVYRLMFEEYFLRMMNVFVLNESVY